MLKKYPVIIQARFNSTRFPGKILFKLTPEYTVLEYLIERLKYSKYYNLFKIVVLISENPLDEKIIPYLTKNKIAFYRGDEEDVHLRYYSYVKAQIDAKYFFRICSDNPLIDPFSLDSLIEYSAGYDVCDYISFKDRKGIPGILTHYGLFPELIKTKSFIESRNLPLSKEDYEHVTPIFYKTSYYKSCFLKIPKILHDVTLRLTLDTQQDYYNLKKVISQFRAANFTLNQLLEKVQKQPEILHSMKQEIIKNKK